MGRTKIFNNKKFVNCRSSYFVREFLLLLIQVGLEKPEEPDISLASNLERQLLYSARPSLFDNKPVSNSRDESLVASSQRPIASCLTPNVACRMRTTLKSWEWAWGY